MNTNLCPVCSMEQMSKALFCPTCSWSFGEDKSAADYDLKLQRAKQQHLLQGSIHQLLAGMKNQAAAIDKMSTRLDKLELQIPASENNSLSDVAEIMGTYPALEPLEPLDSESKRAEWYQALEAQWKNAFNQVILTKPSDYKPSDEDLVYIIETPILRLVGPNGTNPNIDFELTNLSGLSQLTALTLLIVAHHKLQNLSGLEHLSKLEALFVNNNKLTDIKAVHYLPQLIKLYCNVNQIEDLAPLSTLQNIEILNCSYNELTSFRGITKVHAERINEIHLLPNDKVANTELNRIKSLGFRTLSL